MSPTSSNEALGECAVKINEITEGIMDFIRKPNTQQQANQEAVKKELEYWNNFVRKNAVDPKNVEGFKGILQQWANERYPSARNSADINSVNPNNPRSVGKYITDMYSSSMAVRGAGLGAEKTPGKLDPDSPEITQPAATEPQPATQPTAAPNPNNYEVPAFIRKQQAQQAAQQAADAAAAAQAANVPQAKLHKEVQVVDSDPIVLRFRNQDYVLNNQDQWQRFGSQKPVDPMVARFLTKQLQAL